MILSIKNKLAEKYNIKTSEISLVKARGGGAEKVLFFAFSGRQDLPFLCVKASSSESFNRCVEAEFNSLKSVRDFLPNDLKRTIPETFGVINADSHFITLEEFAAGRQASNRMSAADLEKVFNWLCRFHKANSIGSKVVDKDFLITEALKYDLKEKADNSIVEIWGNRSVTMPMIKQHGDFHFANVFFDKDFLKVVDWSNYGKVVLPAYDLIFFLRRQAGGIEANKKMIADYFAYFSIPKEVLNPWVEILGVFENLEKWSRKK